MSSFTITCDRCKMQVDHRCNANLGDTIKQLLKWRPNGGMSEAVIAQAKKLKYFADGDERAPFFSEAFLYNLLGKEDARTFMALIHTIIAEAGIDLHPLREAAHRELANEEAEHARQAVIREIVRRNRQRKCTCKHVYGAHMSTFESMKERKNRRPCAKCGCAGYMPATDDDVLEQNPQHPDDNTNKDTP